MAQRTNLGPLTTAFSYPAHCTTAIINCLSCDVAYQAQTCSDNPNNVQGVQDDAECWPPVADDIVQTERAFGGWGFYSPGFECPGGYETACSATGGIQSDFNFQYAVQRSETAIGCCPVGFQCVKAGGQQTCRSYYSSTSIEAFNCASGETESQSLTLPATYTITDGESVQTYTQSFVSVLAPMIQLNRRASDLETSTEAETTATGEPTTTSSQRTSRPTVATEPTNTGSVSAEDDGSLSSSSDDDGGLSIGAQAGIGVGVGLASLLLILAAVFFWKRKRRTHLASAVPTPEAKPALLSPQYAYHNQVYPNHQQGFPNPQQGYSDAQQGYSDAQQGYSDPRQGYTNTSPGFSNHSAGYSNPSPVYLNQIQPQPQPQPQNQGYPSHYQGYHEMDSLQQPRHYEAP